MNIFKLIKTKIKNLAVGLSLFLVAFAIAGVTNISSLAQSYVSVGYVDAGMTALIGGMGGSPTGLYSCPAGQFVTGVKVREVLTSGVPPMNGSFSSYASRCSTIQPNFTTNSIATTYVGDSTVAVGGEESSATSTFGPYATSDCPSGQVIAGFDAYLMPNPFLPGATLLNAMKIRCSPLIIDPVTKLLSIGAPADQGAVLTTDTSTTFLDNNDCPAGSMATGFDGRTGAVFDQFRFRCQTFAQAPIILKAVDGNGVALPLAVMNLTQGANSYDMNHNEVSVLAPNTYTLSSVTTPAGYTFDSIDCGAGSVTSVTLVNGASSTCTFKYTINAPAAPAITDTDGKPASATTPVDTFDTTPEIKGTGVAGMEITVKNAAGATLCVTTVAAAGTWACSPTTALPLGTVDVTATQKDMVTGVSSPVSNLAKLNIKLPAAPAITDTDGKPASATTPVDTFDTTPEIKGTGVAGMEITVKNAAGATLCVTTVAAAGTWACSPTTALPLGTVDVTATQKDMVTGATSLASNLGKIKIMALEVVMPVKSVPRTGAVALPSLALMIISLVGYVVNYKKR